MIRIVVLLLLLAALLLSVTVAFGSTLFDLAPVKSLALATTWIALALILERATDGGKA